MSLPAVETRDVSKRYGPVQAVRDLSLRVPSACVFGFLGPNGAGKTTTMRMLLGLVRPDEGTIMLGGHDVARDRAAALRGVGSLIEAASLYPHLSGRANLLVVIRLLGLDRSEADRVLGVVDLSAAASRRVGGYSLGMKQRLCVARALLGRPRLLLLDEPTNGLDPEGMADMRALLRDLPERTGGTVFVSSHLLSEVEQVADHVGILREGRLVQTGPVPELLGEAGVRIGVDDPDWALDVLRNHGAVRTAQREGGEQALLVRLAMEGDAEEATLRAACVQALVAAGLAVDVVTPVRRTLDEVYRLATAGPT